MLNGGVELTGWQFGTNKIDKEHIYRMAWTPMPLSEGEAGLWTGEFREPEEEEYYIAKDLTVYKCNHKGTEKKHIAKVVKIKKHEYYIIEGKA